MTTPLDLDSLLAHDDFVRALARSLVADASAADDLAQETWLAALRRPPVAGTSPRSWLATVVRNVARRIERSRARRDARERLRTAAVQLPSTREVVEREAARRSVVEAVLALAEPYRSTILLRYFEGLPPRELARRFGVPVATVRTRARRALEQLRVALDREHGGDRGAWCVALAPLAVAKPASAGVAGLVGVMMGSTAKLGLAMAGVLLVGVSIGLWARSPAPSSPGESAARPPAAAAPTRRTDRPVETSRAGDAPPAPPAMPPARDRAPAEIAAPPPPPASDGEPRPGEDTEAIAALNRLTDSFFGDDPDVPGFLEVLRRLGSSAQIVAGSVHSDGRATLAKIAFRGTSLEADVALVGSRYEVRMLQPGGSHDGVDFVQREISVVFENDGGVATNDSFGVQFHPDTRRPPPFAPGDVRGCGWFVALDSASTRLDRVTASVGPEPGSWRIGNAESAEPLSRPAMDSTPFDAWLRALEPLAR
jgi:RNA polymerase sigma factor (sigma-70 family)